jgi:hypothetical protein
VDAGSLPPAEPAHPANGRCGASCPSGAGRSRPHAPTARRQRRFLALRSREMRAPRADGPSSATVPGPQEPGSAVPTLLRPGHGESSWPSGANCPADRLRGGAASARPAGGRNRSAAVLGRRDLRAPSSWASGSQRYRRLGIHSLPDSRGAELAIVCTCDVSERRRRSGGGWPCAGVRDMVGRTTGAPSSAT